MALIDGAKIDINKFWSKTPTPLKYILLISFIIFLGYAGYSRLTYQNEIDQIKEIKQNIQITYKIVNDFGKYKEQQIEFNNNVVTDIHNIKKVIVEMNYIIDKKTQLLADDKQKNNKNIKEQINLLNQYLDKLTAAYNSQIYYDSMVSNRTYKNNYKQYEK